MASISVALVALACSPGTPTPQGTATPFVRPSPQPRISVPGTPASIRVEVGDDLQALVDANPSGSTYVLAGGVHRLQQVIPHDGDTFRGDPGAVMNGSMLLDAAAFTPQRDGRWVASVAVDGGLRRGQPDEGATEAIRRPEEVFVDGDVRLTHTLSPAQVGPGRFHLDDDRDRLYLGDDPATFDSIELSVTPFAFGGTGVRDVVIEDLIVEKYASPAQFGAIGGAPPEEFPYDWTVRRVEARLNHGGGIGIAPGITVEDSDVHHNGQIGLVGWAQDRSTEPPGDRARLTIRRTRIHHNNQLGFRWTHEAGGTKIKGSDGALIEDVWSHDNAGPGLWFDIENRAATIRSNRIEDNLGSGIFYEISSGPTLIEHNVVRRNGLEAAAGRFAAGVFVSNADDVTVAGNLVVDNAWGIIGISRGDRRPATSRLTVRGNDVTLKRGWVGLDLARDAARDLLGLEGGTRFDGNTYRVPDRDAAWFFWDGALGWDDWRALGHDTAGRLLDLADGPGTLPEASRPFREAAYGPAW